MNEQPPRVLSNINIQNIIIHGESFPTDSHLEISYINGNKEGVGIVYSPKGIKLAELSFHNDKLEGFCIFRNEKGQKVKECVYESGISNGWLREFKDNKPVFTGMCRNGEKYSTLREYNGNSEYLEEIKDGNRISVWKFMDDKHMEGICYSFTNNQIKNIYYYKCGEKNKLLYMFENSRMTEYNENEWILYPVFVSPFI